MALAADAHRKRTIVVFKINIKQGKISYESAHVTCLIIIIIIIIITYVNVQIGTKCRVTAPDDQIFSTKKDT
jgi:hypothetical protein